MVAFLRQQTVIAQPKFPLGISTGFPISGWSTATRDAYYASIKSVGRMTKVRFDLNDATPGGNFELHVNSALKAGLSVLGMIGGSSSMSGATYASRCTTVVSYYSSRVFEWELMNEPNLDSGWANGAAYATVAKAGSDAIRAAQPSATVLLGAISNFGSPPNSNIYCPWNWLTSIYTLAAGRAWFDHVNYHPYGFSRNASGATAFANASGWSVMDGQLRPIMTLNGDASKKIYVTENGGPTWSDGVISTDWTAAAFPSDQGMTEQPVADFHQLCLDDFKTKSWAGDYYTYSFRDRWSDVPATAGTREGHFGLQRSDASEKPALAVLRAA